MKSMYLVAGLLMCSAAALATDLSAATIKHRYVVERTFPQGALQGLDAAQKARVNQTNARFDVNWVLSYANADKTKTYCVYEGPDEAAVRKAADANHMTVDAIMEVPYTLEAR